MFAKIITILLTILIAISLPLNSNAPSSPVSETLSAPKSVETKGRITCTNPKVYDGDNLRCDEIPKGRLAGIDAPEMPSSPCRKGRECVGGDPYASRDHLRGLVAKGNVLCTITDTDHYGRAILRCTAQGVDLSCAQVEADHAIFRYGKIDCL